MDFDAIVIGAGHAGIEAACALARLECRTLLVTQHLDTIGKLSCNPAIGGLAKGNMVREIDALGGQMGTIIDDTMIQFRVLNKSRGPAVQAPRAQADKAAYQLRAKQLVENITNLFLFQDTVVDLLLSSNGKQVMGVKTVRGGTFTAGQVVLTTGTFLNGVIYIGEYSARSGRLGEPAATGLERCLRAAGFRLGRLKTGTPARVHKDSLDINNLERQFGDDEVVPFSFEKTTVQRPQLPCYITFTNQRTHDIIKDNIGRSPLYSGKISGNGPRYCPSIEDKVVKFPDRDRHQIFIEPEGMQTNEMYLNGISSSMPEDVQSDFIHSIAGLEHAYIMRPGYAVEYDYIDPSQLYATLESKPIAGLFIAGQTNGSSGYEEAAGQGLLAGINAAMRHHRRPSLVLKRSEAYIGVMIDDLVTLGTKEPYRMFTSRAEHRLALRHDSCDRRLRAIGHTVGLVDTERFEQFKYKMEKIDEIKELLRTQHIDKALHDRYRLQVNQDTRPHQNGTLSVGGRHSSDSSGGKEDGYSNESDNNVNIMADTATSAELSISSVMNGNSAPEHSTKQGGIDDMAITVHTHSAGTHTVDSAATLNSSDSTIRGETVTNHTPLPLGKSLYDAIKKPEITIQDIRSLIPSLFGDTSIDWLRQIELDIKYEGYVARQEQHIKRVHTMEHLRIPESFDYTAVMGLSNESREKFHAIQPRTIGQASRISGIRSSDIAVLMLAVSAHKKNHRVPIVAM